MKVVDIQEFEHNKAKFLCADYTAPVEGVIAIDNKRMVLKDCMVSLKLVYDRYKYPDQAVITIRSSKSSHVRVEGRNHSSWNTAEGYMPIEDAEALFTEALTLIQKYRARQGRY